MPRRVPPHLPETLRCPECGIERTTYSVLYENERTSATPQDNLYFFRRVGCRALWNEAPCVVRWREVPDA
jgi:hypothetical protein